MLGFLILVFVHPFRFIQTWVFKGICNDMFGEFMIEMDEQYLAYRGESILILFKIDLSSLLRSFVPFVPPFLRSFVPTPLRSFVLSFLRSFAPSFLRSFVPSFLRSFVPSFLRSFVPSFLRSFVPSFLRFFVPSFFRNFVPSCLHSFLACARSFLDVWILSARH